ncbi:MAG: hypothetical protein ABI970_09225, partial [Chloroflexota bacterium]
MYKRFACLVIIFVLATGFVQAQSASASVSLSVEAGFDGTFRENDWIPIYIHVSNAGEGLEGRLVV